MNKLLCSVCVLFFVTAMFSFSTFAASPDGKLSTTWGELKSNSNVQAAPPVIRMGKFTNVPLYTSPPWYPPEEETAHYLWEKGIHWASDDLPVDCVVYTSGAPEGAFDAVLPAFDEWNSHVPSPGIFGTISEDSVGTPPGIQLSDGNTICWMPIDGTGNALAVCYYWYWVNTKELVEFDIAFDNEDSWGIGEGSFFDIQNVMTHELGHGGGVLGDLKSPRDGALTMHAYTWPGDTGKRDMGLGDQLGIWKIYGE